MIGNRSSYDKKEKHIYIYIDKITKNIYKKSSARKFCAFFITRHHEMIGNRSSYDKKEIYVDEHKKYNFHKKDPQENSAHISLLNIMK